MGSENGDGDGFAGFGRMDGDLKCAESEDDVEGS